HDASLEAGALTSAAFSSTLGIAGEYIVSISVVFFGFSTIIGWYVYGIKCFEYLFGVNHLKKYGVIYVASTFTGTLANLASVWAYTDMANVMMMIPNLVGRLLLYKVIKRQTDSFFKPSYETQTSQIT